MRGAAALLLLAVAAPGGTALRTLDLRASFGTRSPWRLTVTQAPEMPDPVLGEGTVPGAITFCLTHGDGCEPLAADLLRVAGSDPVFEPPHELRRVAIVHPTPGRTLLLIQAASLPSGNGNQAVGTALYAYDRAADRFRPVYRRVVGRNTNDEVRYIDAGPLAGAVIAAEPTGDAPFGYWITVARLGAGAYRSVLRYHSATRYGDGNALAVIDSEMPNIRRRLGARGWPLPAPSRACPRPRLLGGELWCGPTPSR